jgi:peptide-methionine (S)-S-oxide reductase
MMIEKATFGAGCFWGVEAEFREIPGVLDAAVGYEGGHTLNPTYKQVCTDGTGHAEVVEIDFEPEKVSYQTLVEAFWKLHDPTQVNRQGPDYGTQYRSAIFFHSPEQEQTARASKEALEASGKLRRPVATVIEPAQTFYRAEDYHQQYLVKRGLRHCHI